MNISRRLSRLHFDKTSAADKRKLALRLHPDIITFAFKILSRCRSIQNGETTIHTSTDVVLRRRVYIFNQSKHGVVLAAYSADVVVIRLVIALTTLRHGYCVRSGDGGAGRGRGGGGGDGAGAGTDRCPKGGT